MQVDNVNLSTHHYVVHAVKITYTDASVERFCSWPTPLVIGGFTYLPSVLAVTQVTAYGNPALTGVAFSLGNAGGAFTAKLRSGILVDAYVETYVFTSQDKVTWLQENTFEGVLTSFSTTELLFSAQAGPSTSTHAVMVPPQFSSRCWYRSTDETHEDGCVFAQTCDKSLAACQMHGKTAISGLFAHLPPPGMHLEFGITSVTIGGGEGSRIPQFTGRK